MIGKVVLMSRDRAIAFRIGGVIAYDRRLRREDEL
jgi:hypothetical protein